MVNIRTWGKTESLNNTTYADHENGVYVAVTRASGILGYMFSVWQDFEYQFSSSKMYPTADDAIEAAERYLDGYRWDENDGSWYIPENIQIGSEE